MQKQRILVLLLAISQPIVAYFSTLGDTSTLMNQMANPLITPAGYAFSIWGLICLGSVAYGIYQVLPRAKNKVYDEIAWPLSGVFAGFSVWLYFAQLEWLLTTIVVFLAMGYFLKKAYTAVLKQHFAGKFTVLEKLIVYGTVSVYAGWATVAIFANIAATAKYYGVSDVTDVGLVWQGLVLIIATITAIFIIKKAYGSYPYAATILWAYIAIIVGTVQRGEVAYPLTMISLVATTVIATFTLTYNPKIVKSKLV